jgi:hypothetical protein
VAFDPPKPPAQDRRHLSTDPIASLGALAAVSGNIDPIPHDMGGVIVDYKKYSNIRGSGEKVTIDGECVRLHSGPRHRPETERQHHRERCPRLPLFNSQNQP